MSSTDPPLNRNPTTHGDDGSVRRTARAAAAADDDPRCQRPPSSPLSGVALPRHDDEGDDAPLPIAQLDAVAHREEKFLKERPAVLGDYEEAGPPRSPARDDPASRKLDNKLAAIASHGGDAAPPPPYLDWEGGETVKKSAASASVSPSHIQGGIQLGSAAHDQGAAPFMIPQVVDAAANQKINGRGLFPPPDSERNLPRDPPSTAASTTDEGSSSTADGGNSTTIADGDASTATTPSVGRQRPPPPAEEEEGDEESVRMLVATPVIDTQEIVRVSYGPQPLTDALVVEGVAIDDEDDKNDSPWWKTNRGKCFIVGLVLLMAGAAAVAAALSSSDGGGEGGGAADASAAATPRPGASGTEPSPEASPSTLRPTGRRVTASPSPPPSRVPSSSPHIERVWEQLGKDVDGVAKGDQFGHSVSLSSNGTTLAVGSPFHDVSDFYSDDSGSVRVLKWDNSTLSWEHLGQVIYGEAGDWSGWSVDLSSDGRVVAVGSIYNQCDNDGSGIVRVYRFDKGTTTWNQTGNGIQGENPYDFSGAAVSLSGDGRTVAIGAPVNGANGLYSSGHVRVYRLDGDDSGDWTQLGGSVNGDGEMDGLGSAAALSEDGSTLAVASPFDDDGGVDSGSVRVRRWNGTDWERIGGTIRGESAGDQLGFSVDVSADGTILAIGSPYHDVEGKLDCGSTRVYEWNEDASDWEPLGQTISGENAGDQSGSSVALSADGETVAVGANFNDGINGEDSGSASVYVLDRGASYWRKAGRDIDGEAAGDWSGRAVALSADGDVVAMGAKYNDGSGGTDSGHARVFRVSD